MKKNDVELGATYAAKVSGKRVHVRIEREGAHGGWEAVNVETGRKIHVKSAQRLRRAVAPPRREATEPTGDADVCATVGCDHPAALTYLGRPRCQECYADEVADGDDGLETPNDQEITMASKKSSKKSAVKTTKAVNVETGRKIHVKSAQRLRRPVAPRREATEPTGDADACATVGCDQPAALTYLGRPRCQECYADECAKIARRNNRGWHESHPRVAANARADDGSSRPSGAVDTD